MRIFLDTEFAERPCTIDLISIGMVTDDGRTLYCVSNEFDESQCKQWVKDNVLPHLGKFRMSRAEIRQEVLDFVGSETPEFWGYYADYDWVVFCWLFGTMSELPNGWPMYCHDLKQLADQLDAKLPAQKDGHHHALNDAIWIRHAYHYLQKKQSIEPCRK